MTWSRRNLRLAALLCGVTLALCSVLSASGKASETWTMIVPADASWDDAEMFEEVLSNGGVAQGLALYDVRSFAGTWNAAWQLLQDDVVQIAVLPADVLAQHSPEFAVLNLPFALITADQARRFWREEEARELLDRASMQSRVAALGVMFDPLVLASTFDCDPSVEAVRGRKIRASGERVVTLLQEAGAAIVSMPAAEVYMAGERGVIDGMVLPVSQHLNFDVQEIARCIGDPQSAALSVGALVLVINGERWAAMSKEIRESLAIAALDWEARSEQHLDTMSRDLEARARTMQLSAAEMAAWRTLADSTVHAEFVRAVGESGSRLLELTYQ